MKTLFLLFAGHALADFALQNEFVANMKSHKSGVNWWGWVMFSHGLIHGGVVCLITGSWKLGMIETLAHCAIDYGKCDGQYGFHVDQYLHFLCKFIYFIVLVS